MTTRNALSHLSNVTRSALLLGFALLNGPSPASANPLRDGYLDLARQGWVFEYNTSIRRRDPSLPRVIINSREIATGPVCVIGETPHPKTRATIEAFDRLLQSIFGREQAFHFGGSAVASCGRPFKSYIRLYSDPPPLRAFNADLRDLDQLYKIGFPKSRTHAIRSPAQAATYFGRLGTTAHVLVKQPNAHSTPLDMIFHRSILIEELFQVFTFGLDILIFDPNAQFSSKLQELPINLRGLRWDSPKFKTGILRSNPAALCLFDAFMLHALATTSLKTTNSEDLLTDIDARFEDLLDLARTTLAQQEFASIFDPDCAPHVGGTPRDYN